MRGERALPVGELWKGRKEEEREREGWLRLARGMKGEVLLGALSLPCACAERERSLRQAPFPGPGAWSASFLPRPRAPARGRGRRRRRERARGAACKPRGVPRGHHPQSRLVSLSLLLHPSPPKHAPAGRKTRSASPCCEGLVREEEARVRGRGWRDRHLSARLERCTDGGPLSPSSLFRHPLLPPRGQPHSQE
jgi:hypothetical protein